MGGKTVRGLKNGCLTADRLPSADLSGVDECWVIGDACEAAILPNGPKTRLFVPVREGKPLPEGCDLYLPHWDLSDPLIDAVIERVLGQGARLMARLSGTLDEVGDCDKRFGLSPPLLLHRWGVLHGAVVTGGVYWDKEDIALLRQEEAVAVLTPSDDLGRGNGVPPAAALLHAGVPTRLGTGSGRYNRTADLKKEAYALKLACAAQLNREDALTAADVAYLLTGLRTAEEAVCAEVF